MREILARLFETRFGAPPIAVIPLATDGSARRMLRLTGPDARTAVGVIGPDREENRAFLSYSAAFRAAGLNVPEIYAVDEAAGVYLEEDLGDDLLFTLLTAARKAEPGAAFPSGMLPVYRRVVRELPRFQVTAGKVADYGVAYPHAAYDRKSIMWDANYFKYAFLKLAKVPFNEARLEDDFERLTEFLLGADRSHFLYRDFQSRNILMRGGEPWFIDYQGGRQGALQYDIASLLYDAKAAIPDDVRAMLLDEYLSALGELLPVDRDRFLAHYRGYVLIRILQAMGAYGYRGFYERKRHFLLSVPYALRNIEGLLADGFPIRLPELEAVFQRMLEMPELRQNPEELVETTGLTVHIGSFSYRNGIPEDLAGHGGGYVFDCRALPNPGREPELADYTGQDNAVVAYLEARPEVQEYWDAVRTLVERQVAAYLDRGFTSLTVQFGCTGGQHRSVYFAERLARHLRARHPELNVRVVHREAARWPKRAPATSPGAGDGGPPARAAAPALSST
ncbi:MAG: phosphotransferase [Gemmatimonadetes bacterium]|nr:phosphotransferase [Gemmatimonadota bacterium]